MTHPRKIASLARAAMPFVIGALLLERVVAQEAPRPEAVSRKDENVVKLNPFVVTTSGDVGYLPQSAISGSRLNTKLSDLAAPITAFTEEFIQDAAITSTDELLGFMASTRVDWRETTAAGSLGTTDGTNVGLPFRIRGLIANPSINFFPTILRLDTYNTARIEQSRGPNSILFGVGSPGGLVNVSTERADLNRTHGEVTLQARSNNGLRAVVDYNQELIKDRWALRVAAVTDSRDTWRYHEWDKSNRIFLTTTWQATPHTQVVVEGEHGLMDKEIVYTYVADDAYTVWAAAGKKLADKQNTALGIVTLSTAQYNVADLGTGKVMNWAGRTTSASRTIDGVQAALTDFSVLPKEVNLFGVGFPQKSNYSRASFFVTHSFTPNLNLEFAGNASDIAHNNLAGGPTNTLSIDTNVTLPNGQPNPNAGRAYVETFPVLQGLENKDRSLRLTLSYEKDLGHIFGHHQLALLGEQDWTEQFRLQQRPLLEQVNGAPFNPTPENGANVLRFRSYFDLDGPAEQMAMMDWRSFDVTSFVDSSSGRTLRATKWINYSPTAGADNQFELKSAIAVLQSRFWKDRLVTLIGYRQDWQDAWYSPTSLRGAPLPGFSLGEYITVRGTTAIPLEGHNRTLGGVFHVNSWLSLTYNNAENVALPNKNAALPTDTGRAPTPKGHSDDYGIKINLGDKVSFTATYFETEAKRDFQSYPQAGQPITQYVNPIWLGLDAAKVTTPDGIPTANHQTAHNGDTLDSVSTGYELELVANPTRNLRIFANYSQVKEVQSNLGQEMRAYLDKWKPFWLEGDNGRVLLDGSGNKAPVADNNNGVVETVAEASKALDTYVVNQFIIPDGQRPRGQVPRRFVLRANYSFADNILRGASIGGGVRYDAGQVTAYDTTTHTAIFGSSNTLVDMNVGYRRPFTVGEHKCRWSVQLNINNLFDNTDILALRTSATGEIINYRMQVPREFILTTKVEF